MKTIIQLLSIKNFLVASFLILMIVGNCYGQISIVVSSSSQQTLTKDEAKEFFSGSKITWSNGKKVQIIDQSETETGKKFYSTFIGKSASQIRVQWTKLVLSGQTSAPVKAANDDDVKKKLSGNPNTVGYISSKSLDSSVKELLRIE